MRLQKECNAPVNRELVARRDRASGWIEENDVGIRYHCSVGEVEHVGQRPGDAVEGASADTLAGEKDVFDEARDGALVGHGQVNRILLGPGRDNQEGLTRTVAATTLRVEGRCADTRQSSGRGRCADADPRSVERVGGGSRAVDEVGEVNVPAI